MVRVRFAPSPTGYLHIGNARTALFNYLFARKLKGALVLRIEDTDTERSKKEYEDGIIEDLKWTGIEWDEGPDCGGDNGPYRQSERLDIYKKYSDMLLSEKKAYHCYCTKEELEARNKEAIKQGRNPGYDNRCRNLTKTQVDSFEATGIQPVVRLLVSPQTIVINDLIRGTVSFESELLNDFVIMKSGGMPTFHFAVVIDDLLMKITHVIRGEDHLSNTPKHILIYQALNEQPPQFAHMSMTLGPDRSRLSKRHGATAVRAYREDGYLNEAFFNYIALLGWGTEESREIFSKEELINEFSMERCSKASAVFDPAKLLWLNGLYVRKTPADKLLEITMPFLNRAGIAIEPSPEASKQLERLITLQQERIKTLKDVPEQIGFFIKDTVEYEPSEMEKFSTPETRKNIEELLYEFKNTENFTKEILEEKVRAFCSGHDIKTSALFHPLRFAVTGRTKGPGLFETMEILGRTKTILRMEKFLGKQ